MNLRKGESIIILTHESGWRKPIQAKSVLKDKFNQLHTRCWFSEWNNFNEAIESISKHHSQKIVIDKQTKLGCGF